MLIYITSEVSIGVPTSMAKLISEANFNTINATNPPIIDTIAAVLPLRLNIGKRPNIIGIAIVPINVANHEIIITNIVIPARNCTRN